LETVIAANAGGGAVAGLAVGHAADGLALAVHKAVTAVAALAAGAVSAVGAVAHAFLAGRAITVVAADAFLTAVVFVTIFAADNAALSRDWLTDSVNHFVADLTA
jgi:hypothetical protein